MSFELSREHEEVRRSVREFADAEIAPHAAQWDREHHFPTDVVQKMGGLLRDIAKTDETKAFLLKNSATPLLTNSVAAATGIVKGDRDLWKKVTAEAKIEPQG